MSSRSAHAISAGLGLATALLMYVLTVIGSVVRTTGSGLACPDWPLCQGRLIPPFEFHVLIEWTHRLVALLVGLLLLATSLWTWTHRETRVRLGGLAALAVALYFVQALLGALTVWKLLSPSMVSSHLAVALLLFSGLLVLTLAAHAEAESEARDWAPRPAGLLPLAWLATAWTWLQSVLGGVVSSSHAGLACPDWPTCHGKWFPPMKGLIGLQMMHRFSAYGLLAAMIVFTILARRAADPRVMLGASLALGLTASQIVLGVCNVLLGTPPWLSALHLATAAAILALMVVTVFRIARLPAAARRVPPAGLSAAPRAAASGLPEAR